jgi:hypothetical protein
MTRAGHGGANRAFVVCSAGASTADQEAGEHVRQTDTRVQDPQALDEIELYGDLVIAASSSDSPLSLDEIDRALGVDRGDPVDRAGHGADRARDEAG